MSGKGPTAEMISASRPQFSRSPIVRSIPKPAVLSSPDAALASTHFGASEPCRLPDQSALPRSQAPIG